MRSAFNHGGDECISFQDILQGCRFVTDYTEKEPLGVSFGYCPVSDNYLHVRVKSRTQHSTSTVEKSIRLCGVFWM